ncbi:HAD-like domain-containing protein [Chytriomyces cf. hyalinus JEL632]|nr:HAD-like domain-containing protein [Chytriomyces cf. hyalinus JEL632]
MSPSDPSSTPATTTSDDVTQLEEQLDKLELESDAVENVMTQAVPVPAAKAASVKARQSMAKRLARINANSNSSAASSPKSKSASSSSDESSSIVTQLRAMWRGCCGSPSVHAKDDSFTTMTDLKNGDAVVTTSRDISLPAVMTTDAAVHETKNAEQVVPVSRDRDITIPMETTAQYVLPPLHPSDAGKKCLVLDLDETLVHSTFKPIPNADFIIPINIEGQYHNVYVLKRPHVDKFLQVLGKQFEVVIFTASMSNYANPVLDLLDTTKVVKHRLFREHCVFHETKYVKDLSVLGRPLESTMILDNAPESYMFQKSNGVPCQSWFKDMDDDELDELIPFFEGLKTVEDVRTVLGMDDDDMMEA